MWKNYLKIALRNITRYKSYSILNVTGLIIGLACCVLIMLYIQYELSFDQHHRNASNIHRVATELQGHTHSGLKAMAMTRGPLAPALLQESPQVDKATRIWPVSSVKLKVGDTSFHEETIFFADAAVFEVFTLPLVKGATEAISAEPFSVVLSQRIAQKYFGDANPIGQTIQYMGDFDFKVTAIMQNMPRNSHFVMDFVFPLTAYELIADVDMTNWQQSSCYTYLLLTDSADPGTLESQFPALVKKYDTSARHGRHGQGTRLFLQPLSDIHLHSHMSGEIAPNGDIKNIYLFATIALVILIIGCLNYVNLATAHSIKRCKEVGIRKTVGARKTQIMRQFLSESFLLTLLALILAIFLVELALPAFNAFVERELQFAAIANLRFALCLFALISAVGFFSGSYPALFASSFRPATIMQGSLQLKHGRAPLRNLFVLLQFAISIIFIISTLVIKGQINYIFSRDVGYEKEHIVSVQLRDDDAGQSLEFLKTQLLTHPDILQVASSTYLPNSVRDQTAFRWPGKPDDVDVRCYVSFIDYDYVDLYGIEIVEGRNFSPEHPSDKQGAFLINQTAVKDLGWQNPVGHQLTHWNGQTGQVVGVVRDFNFHSLHKKIEPMYLYFEPKVRSYYISLKISSNRIPKTIDYISEKVTSAFPNYPFEYNFFDDLFDKSYKQERRMDALFSLFTLTAIVVSCLGLLGLVSYTTERRIKEIGIRKVLGAKVSGLVFMLSREFAKWVLLANFVAWPVAYIVMDNWLQNFAYQTGIDWWVFLVAGGAPLSIALTTVSFQAIRAALANPVESLRYQ